MRASKIVLIILSSILFITLCSPPPSIELMKQIVPETPKLINKDDKTPLSFKRLEGETPSMKIVDSIATITFQDEYQIIEHRLNIIAENLSSGYYFEYYDFNILSDRISEISNSCELTTSRTSDDTCTETHNIEGGYIHFSYSFHLYNGDSLTLKYSYKQSKSNRQILYKQESIVVPLISGSTYCNYKFIIPDGYISLGLQKNLLTKQSDNIYIYNKECPTTFINDVIRYSPETVSWKADMELYLEKPSKFTNDVGFIFPRYYRGGKLKNTYYRIFSTEGEEYKEENQIKDYLKLDIKVPALNEEKVGVLLHTAFTNTLGDNFNVYLPSNYYEINLDNIDNDIKTKVDTIKNQDPSKPEYYNIGKFVHDHITYDRAMFGKNLTLKEIFEGKKGVCEHYTLLYNAMLNCIGIKTLYISGWAFQGSQTSYDRNTEGHAWTSALINNKWVELDATWGLFEGIPAGHILKNFNQDAYSFYWTEASDVDIKYSKVPSIEMITDQSKLIDPYTNSGIIETTSSENGNNNINKADDDKDDDDDDEQEEIGNYLSSSLILLFVFCLSLFF